MASDDQALTGIRVLDCATFIAAPVTATVFAEFGAEVIKIEQPGVGDPFRRFGTPTERGDTLAWLTEARNKKSITLNLSHPEGADLFRQLVSQADVVCENFRPGTLENWGLGYAELAAINPSLVMVRITGYGQDGPYRNRPGFARIAHAMGGLTYLAGMPDGPPVTPGSTSLGDYISGLYGALGALIALRAREHTGKGQFIDIGLYESVFRMLDETAPAFARHGVVRERMGPGAPNVCPHSHYQAKDGKWLAIACTTDKMFARLSKVMGQPELAEDDRYGPVKARLADRVVVDGIVGAWTGSLTREEVLVSCEEGQVPCGSVNTIADIFADPHFQARGNLETFDVEGVGPVTVPSVVPRLSATPGHIDNLGPPLGNANDEIYCGLLGIEVRELERLRREGVV